MDPNGESPLDVGFFIADTVSFGLALYSGNPEAIAFAGVDLAASAVGLASPIPGTGLAIKAARAADKVGDAASVLKGVAPAKRASSQTVLGSYPDYVNLSDKLGARRLDIPTDIWSKMTLAQRWAANQKFLDRMISKGDEVILSNSANKAQPGTFFAREMDYLTSQGYRVSDDGLRMLPGP